MQRRQCNNRSAVHASILLAFGVQAASFRFATNQLSHDSIPLQYVWDAWSSPHVTHQHELQQRQHSRQLRHGFLFAKTVYSSHDSVVNQNQQTSPVVNLQGSSSCADVVQAALPVAIVALIRSKLTMCSGGSTAPPSRVTRMKKWIQSGSWNRNRPVTSSYSRHPRLQISLAAPARTEVKQMNLGHAPASSH
jgi:hypothetical protein